MKTILKKIIKSKHIVLFVFLMGLPPLCAIAGLTVTDNGTGIGRTVSVESAEIFRLVFVAADNWGIAQYYDLSSDPTGSTNLAKVNSTNLAKVNSTNPGSEESGLFQEVWYGTTPNDPKLYIMAAKYNWPNSVGSLNILEENSNRVIIETSGHPMLAAGVVENLTVVVKYCIYSTGKIIINTKLTSTIDQKIKEWRNSVIGLSDPSYCTKSDSGKNGQIIDRKFTDSSKNWLDNEWKGYLFVQADYNFWEISGNTKSALILGKQLHGNRTPVDSAYSILSRVDRYGWIRATDSQNPYTWQGQKAKYLFEYWDPSTPAPYTNWTQASILLVPAPNNPYQGKQGTHEWKGFKRFYYHSNDVELKKGDTIIQHYYMQLGTKKSSILPDLSKQVNDERYASDYLADHSIKVETGILLGNGFDLEKGCYTLAAHNKITTFALDGSVTNRIKPVFEITHISPDVAPEISLDGKILQPDTDFTWHNDKKGMLLVQLFSDINSRSIISIRPSKSVAPSSLTSSTEKKLSNSPASNTVVKSVAPPALASLTEKKPVSPSASYTTVIPKRGSNNKSPTSLQRYAILSYSNDNPRISSWIDERFAYKISGNKPADPNVKWMTYFDIYGIGSLSEYLTMKDFAIANGFTYEDMLLHSKKNFTSRIPEAFHEMDRFGVFEGKNGVLKTKDFKTFEDFTSKAYKGDIPLSNGLYIGYEEPFAEVNWEFKNAGNQVHWLCEFSNGSSWSPLSVSDETGDFSRNGRMAFIPPENWKPTSINGSRQKYFIRVIIKDANTYPVSSRIYGDDWLNGKSNSCRGWDEHNPGIVNSGALAFNLNPPPDASARFRYQSRISFWSNNHFIANPADVVQIGKEKVGSWAKFAAEQIISMAKSKGYSGVMGDDAQGNVASDGVKPELSDFPAGKVWEQASIAKYRDIVRFVKETNPDLLVGANSQQKQLVQQGDWNLAEYNTFVWKTGSAGSLDSVGNATTMAYDDYLAPQGEKAITGLLIYQDTTDTVPGLDVVWDRSNRGPIAALSKHYIGMNKNTIFSYYSRGGYIYSETDEVILKNKKIVHQASEPTPKIEDVSRWATWFPAMGVDIGSPDINGHDGGKRDTAWKKGKDIGGGPDIWRRDFTNALVLHRPAFYNTTKTEYNTSSNPIPLEAKYYPLRADGITGPATDHIALRAGEGAILMKVPIVNPSH